METAEIRSSSPRQITAAKRLKPAALSLFCYQLSVLFRSGIPLLEGLSLLEKEMTDLRLKKAAAALYQDIHHGSTFQESITRQPGFPPYLTGMLAIAESTGRLDEETRRLSDYYDRLDQLEQRIKSAVAYPLILAVMMTAVVGLLIFRILPMFHQILVSIGGSIPGSTQVMVSVSRSLQQGGVVMMAVAALVIAGLVIYTRSGAGRSRWDRWKLTFPPTRTVASKIIAFRISHALSLLIAGGMAFDESLQWTESIVENQYAAGQLRACRKAIEEGTPVAEAFEQVTILPELLIRMVRIGAQTGQMEDFLARSAVMYQQETDRSLQRLTAIVEPALVIVLSLIIGVILMAVMLPLIQILSTIG
ncbi:type II secretion system F family protein [Anoxynatronum sibiricum]|uniref:Type II secretion system F family protein n=1 Tax=Anoxynatronum sibiricum TaxID=210623 RepID=A0ABU9VW60_9CLOT